MIGLKSCCLASGHLVCIVNPSEGHLNTIGTTSEFSFPSSDEFWSCCSLASSLGGLPSPVLKSSDTSTETPRPGEPPDCLEMHRSRTGGVPSSFYGGGSGSGMYGNVGNPGMYGNGNKSHGRKEERTLSVTFGRGDGDKVQTLYRLGGIIFCLALQWDSVNVDSRREFVFGISRLHD